MTMVPLDKMVPVDNAPSGCYGEWVYYDTDKERDDAVIYLNLWKKFFLKKIQRVVVNEQIIHREILPYEDHCVPKGKYTIGLKIEVK